MIRGLGSSSSMPWLLAGDFNGVLFETEKVGGNACDLSSIMGFRDAIDGCNLKDLGCSGYKFTWSNCRGENFIEECLDRALANEDWMDLFASFSVENIVWDSSDHLPILVRACKHVGHVDRSLPWDEKPFRFEAKWMHVDSFGETVASAWAKARKMNGTC